MTPAHDMAVFKIQSEMKEILMRCHNLLHSIKIYCLGDLATSLQEPNRYSEKVEDIRSRLFLK